MIKAAFFDIDGVLTDGKVSINSAGEESKTLSFEDIDALFRLNRAGIKIGFITGEDNGFTDFIKKRFPSDYFIAGCKDKLGAFKALMNDAPFTASEACFLGDSDKDIELLGYLEHSYVPADVSLDVKAAAGTTLRSKRGAGAVRELAGIVLGGDEGSGDTFFSPRIGEHIEVVKAMRSDPELVSGIRKAGEMIVACVRSGGKVLLCGNGGSAADAQHLATELVSRFMLERPGIPAEALTTNSSSLTAVGNDYGFDHVFQRQVEANGKKGDILIGISTSGNSANVIAAMARARQMELLTIGLTGAADGTGIIDVSDSCIRVPSNSTPRIQEGHILIGHMICEYVESSMFGPEGDI
jgi:D-sedoheptulose 7-phosphate isomerase